LLEALWTPSIVTTTVLKAYEVNHIMMNVAGVASYAWQ
jgi:hypothetical protein